MSKNAQHDLNPGTRGVPIGTDAYLRLTYRGWYESRLSPNRAGRLDGRHDRMMSVESEARPVT